MKKYLLIILCLAMAFVSCKKNETNPDPIPDSIDKWIGNYTGEINFKGTALVPNTLGDLVSDTIDETICNLPMSVSKTTSQTAIFTIKIGDVPVPLTLTVNDNTATMGDYTLPYSLPITIGDITLNYKDVKITGFTLNYTDGVITGSGKLTASSEALDGPGTITYDLNITPKFNKQAE